MQHFAAHSKNGGEYTIGFIFSAFFQQKMKGDIHKMRKILGLVLSIVLILSSFSVLAVSATEPIAPTLPDNAIAVIDANGVSKTLGDNGDWAPQWWEGRFTKTGLSADVSDADFIEFDIKFSDYEAFTAFMNENGVNFSINFTSTNDNVWASRSAAVINYFGTPIGNGWYHYIVPMSSFVAWDEIPTDWSDIKTWHLYSPASDGSQKPFGELCSETLTIINICATKSNPPASPENAVAVLDTEGYSGKVGDHAGNTMTDMYGRFNKIQQTAADFSNADYIEFDIYYSDYESFVSFANTNGINFGIDLTSNAGMWDERVSSNSIFGYGEAVGNGWYHYVIPKSEFNKREGTIDWSAVDTWYLIGEGPAVAVGEVYADIVAISNICGTTVTEPSMPEEAVTELDAEGVSNTLGDNGSWAAQWWEGRFTKRNLSVDLTGADYIEFDIYYSDYNAFANYLDTNNIDFSINITSSANTENPSWEARSAASIRDYEYDMGYGWYHYIIPKTAFVLWDKTPTDWSNVTTWHLYSPAADGTQKPFGELCSDTLTIKNICGTVREELPDAALDAPELPGNVVALLDRGGSSTTVGDSYVWMWDRLYKNASADLSNAEYIEFDLKISDYELLKSDVQSKGYPFVISLSSNDSAGKWANRFVSPNLFDYETGADGSWHHYSVPVSLFVDESGDWSNINSWMFGFNYAPDGATGELSTVNIEVKNICGTTYSFDKTGYTMVDEYAVIGTDKQVSDIVTDLTKVYDVNGIAVDSGSVVTGMSVRCEFDGWVYDQATFVIDNDIDGDGAVTASDMVAAKKFYFGAAAATEIQNVAFTGSKTAEATIIDYIQMKNAILEG